MLVALRGLAENSLVIEAEKTLEVRDFFPSHNVNFAERLEAKRRGKARVSPQSQGGTRNSFRAFRPFLLPLRRVPVVRGLSLR
jgi:hypothetical protein